MLIFIKLFYINVDSHVNNTLFQKHINTRFSVLTCINLRPINFAITISINLWIINASTVISFELPWNPEVFQDFKSGQRFSTKELTIVCECLPALTSQNLMVWSQEAVITVESEFQIQDVIASLWPSKVMIGTWKKNCLFLLENSSNFA